ncbi:unnamed protein product [Haemonchus placei]|uniref:Secreted protein n=1 Tax=Haemonchus placei TaxID=6290 RepID=A0A0N4VU45_HAEPC|nr:unnamed protein product [Haemonchus placei]
MKGCLQILFEYSPYYIPVLFVILLQSLLLCKRQSRSKDVVTPVTATTQQSFKEIVRICTKAKPTIFRSHQKKRVSRKGKYCLSG